MPVYRDPDVPDPMEEEYSLDTEAVVATLAQISATRGDAPAVAVLAESDADVRLTDKYQDFGKFWYQFRLRLTVEPGLYGRLADERAGLTERLGTLAYELSAGYDENGTIRTVAIVPRVQSMDGWRPRAKAWARGEGVTNQGRVRSDNIASKLHDGLLFRSQPEINLYAALKALDVYLAPLPVFVRGGKNFQRLEPDFVIVHRGVMLVVEVDGATVHRETPAEAYERTKGLDHQGVRVMRVSASDCETAVKAHVTANRIMETLRRYRELGG